MTAPDSELYWRGQMGRWRSDLEAALEAHPFQLRVIQSPISPPIEAEAGWLAVALAEVAELRRRLEATIERINPEG